MLYAIKKKTVRLAYKNAGGNIELRQALIGMMNRGKSVPDGACGFWGACGAGISTGMFISIISNSTPLAVEQHFQISMEKTETVCSYSAQNNQCIGNRCPFSGDWLH